MDGWSKTEKIDVLDGAAMRLLLRQFAEANRMVIRSAMDVCLKEIENKEGDGAAETRTQVLKELLLDVLRLYNEGYVPDTDSIDKWIWGRIDELTQSHRPPLPTDTAENGRIFAWVDIPEADWKSCERSGHGMAEVQEMFGKVVYIDADEVTVMENGRRLRFVQVADGRFFYSVSGKEDILRAQLGGIEIWGLPTGRFSVEKVSSLEDE